MNLFNIYLRRESKWIFEYFRISINNEQSFKCKRLPLSVTSSCTCPRDVNLKFCTLDCASAEFRAIRMKEVGFCAFCKKSESLFEIRCRHYVHFACLMEDLNRRADVNCYYCDKPLPMKDRTRGLHLDYCFFQWKTTFSKYKCPSCQKRFSTSILLEEYIKNPSKLQRDIDIPMWVFEELIMYAVTEGDLNFFESLYNSNIHMKEELALRLSAEFGRLDLVQFLIEHGTYVHAQNHAALILSATNGHFEIVKYLVEQAAADVHVSGGYALTQSASNGHIDIVKYLLKLGVNVHANEESALIISSKHGHFEIVKCLIENGADFRVDNYRPFRNSVISGHLDMIKYLVNLGADPHIGFNYDTIEADIEFPLIYSASNGSIEIVKYLVEECRADIHAEGDKALLEASKNNHREVLIYLNNCSDRIENENDVNN